jgi:CubicO group peptidase (beta-lactamase class C family)
MLRLTRLSLLAVVCVVLLAGTRVIVGEGIDVKLAPPESVGFSSQKLKAYEQSLRSLVDEGRLAGFTTLVSRHGKVVAFDAYGHKDVAARTPMTKDTIFRIASMTKPIVGVAMMMLWEEGKWSLDDPVHKFIPQFKDLQVKTDAGVVAQTQPMTMRQLMSHTAGFDVDRGYADVRLSDGDLQGMIDKLAALPLAAQPGTDWRYGPSVNIQGYIVEKISGQTLDRFLATRIFEPLKMKDTGFWVEPGKRDRLTRLHTYGPDKRVVLAQSTNNNNDPTRRPRFLSGSGGLLSTTEDYWRFAQMLLDGGQLEGARLLKQTTVELMRTNVLNDGVQVDLYGPKENGIGFGLDFAIVMDPAAANTPRGKNTFYWGGAFGTWFWIDPTNDVVVVGMIQNVGGSIPTGDTPPMRAMSSKMVYDALTNPTTR